VDIEVRCTGFRIFILTVVAVGIIFPYDGIVIEFYSTSGI
jgi:hypothetical protein